MYGRTFGKRFMTMVAVVLFLSLMLMTPVTTVMPRFRHVNWLFWWMDTKLTFQILNHALTRTIGF